MGVSYYQAISNYTRLRQAEIAQATYYSLVARVSHSVTHRMIMSAIVMAIVNISYATQMWVYN
jgi:tRNA splicing endonuclease